MLRMEYAGRRVLLDTGWHDHHRAAGLVYLIGDPEGLEDVLPPAEIPHPDDPTAVVTLRGFADDPRVASLKRTLIEAAARPDFRPGPVAVPG